MAYADLSDFFYVWLRRTLRPVFPGLFATLATPKDEELVAAPHRHGGRAGAEAFFLGGMRRALERLAEQAHPAFPVTLYYAFKQAETKREGGTVRTGWETFLEAVIGAGFSITGTWPLRTELSNRMVGMGTNALASSVVLACRRRPPGTAPATRRQFVAALRRELPEALAPLRRAHIAPVDLAQAAIGPGMAIFTRTPRVLEAGGGRWRWERRSRRSTRCWARRFRSSRGSTTRRRCRKRGTPVFRDWWRRGSCVREGGGCGCCARRSWGRVGSGGRRGRRRERGG